MAEGKGLDLAHPGGKEILIAGGVAVVLGVIYLKLNANKTGAGGGAGVPASGRGLGGPANTPGFFLGGSGATGNILTDSMFTTPASPTGQQGITIPTITGINGNVPTIQRGDGGGIGGRPPGPRIDLPHPRIHGATQGAQDILGGGGMSTSGPPVAGGPPIAGVSNLSPTANGVYTALRQAGLSPTQAAGVMGNIINESAYNPEAIGDQGTSFGLVQWHYPSHSNARQYVTGNIGHDLANQIASIVQVVKSLGLPANASPGQVAATFASQFEGCVGCQPGGAQYNARVANANAVWQQIQKGIITAQHPNVSTGGGNIPAWELKGSGLTEAQARALTPSKLAAYIQSLFPKVTPKTVPPIGHPAPHHPAPRRRPAPRGRPAYHAVGGIAAGISRLAAIFRPPPRPAPKPPTQSPHHQRFVGGY